MNAVNSHYFHPPGGMHGLHGIQNQRMVSVFPLVALPRSLPNQGPFPIEVFPKKDPRLSWLHGAEEDFILVS